MKLKVAIASVAVVATAIVAFAFAKPTSTADYQYTLEERLIATGQDLSLDVTDMGTASNWNTGLPSVSFSGTGAYLRAIEFNEESTANGGSDGSLTKQEALNAVKAYYNTNHSLPTSITEGTTVISIFKSDNNQ